MGKSFGKSTLSLCEFESDELENNRLLSGFPISSFSFHCCCGQQIASWGLVGFSLLGRISRLTILRFKTSSSNYSGNGNHLGRENIRGENGKRPWIQCRWENSFNVGTDKQETDLFVMTFKAIMEGMNPVQMMITLFMILPSIMRVFTRYGIYLLYQK